MVFLNPVRNMEADAASQGKAAPGVKEPRVITVAYFPMAMPVGLLGETLKRDRVLQKALKRDGITIAFQTFAKGNDVLPLIRKGKIDAVMFADFPSIEAASTGEMLIIGTAKRSFASVVAPLGTRIEQLRKRKVGNAYGSTSHYALLQALGAAGLSEKDITLVPLEVNQMADALASGAIDAFAAWEPTPTAAFNKYPGRFASIHRQLSSSYFLVSARLALEQPAAADALASALLRSVRWLKKGGNLDTASGWALAGMRDFNGKVPSLSVADVAAITHNDLLDVSGAPLLSAAGVDKKSPLHKEFDFLKKIGKLPDEASAEKLRSSFKEELLARLLKNPARYQLNTFEYAP
jgi:NitT/TauT family transport system substrate-binding protein